MTRPLRILDCTPSLNTGGIAASVTQNLAHLDRSECRIDFLLQAPEGHDYEDRARQLGARIASCPDIKNPLRLYRDLVRMQRRHGPYDILHAHPFLFSGLVMFLGKLAGFPVRIAHSHSAIRTSRRRNPLIARPYTATMRFLLRRYASAVLAVSEPAAEALCGPNWKHWDKVTLLPDGIDFSDFGSESVAADTLEICHKLATCDVRIGLIGRLEPPKNPVFALRVFTRFLRIYPRAKLLIVGDGPLAGAIKAEIHNTGLQEHVLMTGARNDVPGLMTNCLDALLFPSLHEGLGRVAIEAQAAGLTVLASDHVPDRADLGLGLMQRLPLSQGEEAWAGNLKDILEKPGPDRENALQTARNTEFDIHNHVAKLKNFYESLCRQNSRKVQWRAREDSNSQPSDP